MNGIDNSSDGGGVDMINCVCVSNNNNNKLLLDQ
jgi:hypothetical protein